MTARDRTVLIVVAIAASLAGFWFMAVSPKRQDAADLRAQITVAEQRLQTAETAATDAQAARQAYASDYATVARLGKAVPVDDDVPSLVYQLETTAHRDKVDFRSIKLSSSGTATSTPAGNASAVASANGTSASSGPASASPSAAPAALPPGATVGSAGFPTMPFSFNFQGSFRAMQRFLGSIVDLTTVKGDNIDVKGRLLTVDGVQLKAGPEGFPRVDATVAVTAYLLPADQGLTAGATATTPSTTTASATTTSTPPATTSLKGSN